MLLSPPPHLVLVLVYILESGKCLLLHPLAQIAQFPEVSRVHAPRPREQPPRLVRELGQHRRQRRLEQGQHLKPKCRVTSV